ncbi:MAG: hypothetical protein EZS28_031316 [Streblomastix strix]|uniref:Uncharacterized protein n=1 Tax=Streblomastix strix TaxID=222440 RepID=A0A5J4URY1_9EUKA|nr:MAG: hypothetical protein EZS28_031316 [Streblomastix strix]
MIIFQYEYDAQCSKVGVFQTYGFQTIWGRVQLPEYPYQQLGDAQEGSEYGGIYSNAIYGFIYGGIDYIFCQWRDQTNPIIVSTNDCCVIL